MGDLEHIEWVHDDFLFSARPTIKSIINSLPKGADVVNLTALPLLLHFPPKVVESIGEYVTDGGFDENPTSTMRKYMDKVYMWWLKTALQVDLLTKLGYIILFAMFLLNNSTAKIVTVIVALLMSICSGFVTYYTWKYWKKGFKQFKLWRFTSFDLKSRAFCQLRGILQFNTLGKHYDNLNTGKFCGQSFNSCGDNFLSPPYILMALVGRLFAVALPLTMMIHFVAFDGKNETVNLAISSLPLLIFPLGSWGFFPEIQKRTQSMKRIPKGKKHISHTFTYGVACVAYFAFWALSIGADVFFFFLAVLPWLFATCYLMRFRASTLDTIVFTSLFILYFIVDEHADIPLTLIAFIVAAAYFTLTGIFLNGYLYLYEEMGKESIIEESISLDLIKANRNASRSQTRSNEDVTLPPVTYDAVDVVDEFDERKI